MKRKRPPRRKDAYKKKSDLREAGIKEYETQLPHLKNPHKSKKSEVMEATTLSEARIYVGTYGKYNDGSIEGKWFDLSDFSDKDEFLKACAELHSDETDPEYMFQDWENIPESLIGESWLSDNFFPLRDAMDDLSDTEQEAFMVWCNNGSHDFSTEDADDLVSSFRDDYQGQYDDEEDYAYEVIEQCYDLPEFAKSYFDYGKFAHDLFIGDYWFEDGFVFRAS